MVASCGAIVVVVDVSQSMLAVDVKPNRLDAAKSAARAFVKALPSKYNVAVVSLSASPSILLPPSTDRSAADRAISTLEPEDGTALGDSIQVALDAVALAPKSADDTVAPGLVVLLSDGQSTTGQSALQMADRAKQKKIDLCRVAELGAGEPRLGDDIGGLPVPDRVTGQGCALRSLDRVSLCRHPIAI